MNKNQSYIYLLFVLKQYLPLIFGPHYPTEIIQLIIMATYAKVRISCRCNHTNVIHGFDIYTFGRNDLGQLGLGDMSDRNLPQKLIFPEKHDIVEMNSVCHTAMLTCSFGTSNINQQLYVWGCNTLGHLGLGHIVNVNIPLRLTFFENFNIIKTSCGTSHTVALVKSCYAKSNILSSNILYVWGSNGFGQLGLGNWNDQLLPQELILCEKVISVCCGSRYTMTITESNCIYAWGANTYGELGLGHHLHVNQPSKLGLNDIVKVYCGAFHVVVLTSRKRIYVWGRNDFGQLGLGFASVSRPSPCELDLQDIVAVSCGGFHTIALSASGKLYSWGHNNYGQLGLGDYYIRLAPCEVKLCRIREICSGDGHTVVLDESGLVYVWGHNHFGQLGLGDFNMRCIPSKLKF